jgi:hypothetical protein
MISWLASCHLPLYKLVLLVEMAFLFDKYQRPLHINGTLAQLDHRIYLVLGQNKSVLGMVSSPVSQINLASPAE